MKGDEGSRQTTPLTQTIFHGEHDKNASTIVRFYAVKYDLDSSLLYNTQYIYKKK